jgi:hypothetical protein
VTGLGAGGAGAEPTPRRLEELWRDLGGADAGRAYDAVWRLAAAPRQAVPLLRGRMRPAAPVPAGRIARWVADLDDDNFAVREQASRELEAAGGAARAALQKALAGEPSAEVRRRAEALLQKLDGAAPSPGQLRPLRALEALEQCGTPEARQALRELAEGAPGARLTEEARAALRRLGSPR